MPISLGVWEWGCLKRVDAHITVTTAVCSMCEQLVPPPAFAGGAIACVAVGIVPQVLSWRAEPPREIAPATFLMRFECRPVMSPWLKPFDYPIRKSGVSTKLTCKRARPSVTIKSRTKTTTCCKLFRNQAGYSAVTPNMRNENVY